jgi:hypothetical protein
VQLLKVKLRVDPGTDLRPYEALAELRAITFMVACAKATYPDMDEQLRWTEEKRWALEQSGRLMTHERLSGFPMWTEKTNTMSYLLLRAALMTDKPAGFPSNDFRVVTSAMMHGAAPMEGGPGPVQGISLRFTSPEIPVLQNEPTGSINSPHDE